MEDIQVVTIILAVYGALLSTILAAYKYFENKRRLKVRLSTVIVPHDRDRSNLSLSCSNIGKRPVTLTSYGIVLPNKKRMIFPTKGYSNGLPLTISDGECCTLFTSLGALTADLAGAGYKNQNSVKLVGYFDDATGKRHYGKKFNFPMR